MSRTLWRFRERYFQKFFFIHINKTGGSSVEEALRIPHKHRTARETIDEFGLERWSNRFTFTVVRNPWDRVVSHYHYRLEKEASGWGKNPIGFNEWVKATYALQDPVYYRPRMFMPQVDWIADEAGNILVEFVARMENLSRDFQEICERLDRTAALPHLKRSRRGNYRDYYSEESVEIVRHWGKGDIEQFGYSFE